MGLEWSSKEPRRFHVTPPSGGTPSPGVTGDLADPRFWATGAIATTFVMLVVLAFLSVDSMRAIDPGGSHVPDYDVINQHIGYQYDWARHEDMPVIGGPDPLFGKTVTEAQAAQMIWRGKLAIQSRNCMNCHTFFGNGAYYGPDLTKAWLDPAWREIFMRMTGASTKEQAMVMFLMNPDKYPTWTREMPNLHLSQQSAEDLVAYLKWMSSINTNGFPANFGPAGKQHQVLP